MNISVINLKMIKLTEVMIEVSKYENKISINIVKKNNKLID